MTNIDTKELMNSIIISAIERKASDIHIYPNMSREISKIKFRIKGELEEDIELSNTQIDSIISLLKFNASIDIAMNKVPQSGKFEYLYNDKKYFLRVSTLPLTEILEGCVIRIFTDELSDVSFSIFEEDSQKIINLSKNANGLIIFSGPTGSGKSTSMYKLAIEFINRNKQIISIEDPVEKHIDGIIQMQVNEKAGINYDNALKSILRCDPDVIMVGEIRDSKTAKYVVTSSFSGHLVITTLHAEDTLGVIYRLLDLGIGKEDLSQTVLCIISQRLVKTTNNTQQLVTEILEREQLKHFLKHNRVDLETLRNKMKKLCDAGEINVSEKEKWGY